MKIVVAGASGFIGTRLVAALRPTEHQVVQLVRRAPTGPDQVQWNPDSGQLDRSVLEDAGAVVNLCGAGAGDKRWNDAYRRLIVTSRVRPTELLAQACADAGTPALINGSAIGFYGHRGDETVDESSGSGSDFFAGVCRDWEAATVAADESGTRVVHLRTGLVLGHEGGLLPKLLLVTKLFAGGRLGSGKQYYSWISAVDAIAAIQYLLTADLAGPVNLTAPNPVRNAEFVREIGRAAHRPTPWIVPEFAIDLVVGGFAGEIVNGQRVVPTVLEKSGFTFTHPTLPEALRSEIP